MGGGRGTLSGGRGGARTIMGGGAGTTILWIAGIGNDWERWQVTDDIGTILGHHNMLIDGG